MGQFSDRSVERIRRTVQHFEKNGEFNHVGNQGDDLLLGGDQYGSSGNTLMHPFKVTPTGLNNDYVIGVDRGESFYTMRDLITIHDMQDSKIYTIEKTAPEAVAGPGTISGAGPIIYYKLQRTQLGAQPWTATVVTEAAWPPATMEDYQDTLFIPIAQMFEGGGVGQLQFSDISVWVRPMQPSFSAYRYDGGVAISDGVVYCSKDHATAVTGATVPDGGTQSAWVEIVTAPDAVPTVNGTVQVGAWPGYESEAAGTLTRRIRLGTFSNQLWTPNHVGHIFLGTLYQPSIPLAAQYNDAQGYKVLAGTPVSVGSTKDLFFDGVNLGIDVIGGNYEKISSIGTVKFGGTSRAATTGVITGASRVGDNLVLTNVSRQLDVSRGLTQEYADTPGADIIIPLAGIGSVLEGPGIDVVEAPAGTFTITSLLVDINNGVDVVLGAAGAAHTIQLNYPTIWGNVSVDGGITKNVLGDVITIGFNAPTGVAVKQSIEWDVDNTLHLVGDEAAPADFKCYGQQLVGGGKGWFTIEQLCDNSPSIATNAPGLGLGTTFDVILTVDSSIEETLNGLELVNDALTPTDFSVYGFRYAADEKKWSTINLFFKNSNTTQINAPGVGIGNEATFDVITQMSITSDVSGIKLTNDETSPTAWKFYGTEGTPTKGFQQAATITVITAVQLDASNNLQIKTRQIRAFDLQTESAWTTVTGWATTACP